MASAALAQNADINIIFGINDSAALGGLQAWKASGRSRAEHSEESLIQAMIGRRIEALYPRTRGPATGPEVLRVEGLSATNVQKDNSFAARAGEVVGFFGLTGAGRRELAEAIIGFDPVREGHISVAGRPLVPHDTASGVALGIGLLSEDRKREGLMLDLPVVQNATLAGEIDVSIGSLFGAVALPLIVVMNATGSVALGAGAACCRRWSSAR